MINTISGCKNVIMLYYFLVVVNYWKRRGQRTQFVIDARLVIVGHGGNWMKKGKGGMNQVVDHREVIDEQTVLGHVSQLLLWMHVRHGGQRSFSDIVGGAFVLFTINDGKVRTLVVLLLRFGQRFDL